MIKSHCTWIETITHKSHSLCSYKLQYIARSPLLADGIELFCDVHKFIYISDTNLFKIFSNFSLDVVIKNPYFKTFNVLLINKKFHSQAVTMRLSFFLAFVDVANLRKVFYAINFIPFKLDLKFIRFLLIVPGQL